MSKIIEFCCALIFTAYLCSDAAMLTVSKSSADGGAFSSVNSALAAAKEGDEIVVLDNEIYEEQVTVTLNNLTIRSENPTNPRKPVIKWQDTQNVGPRTSTEALDTTKITFDQNGALRIMKAQNVTIDGIAIDGGGAYPFGYTAIWNGKDPLFHGNVGVLIWISGKVVIRNCDIYNSFFGLHIRDRNEGGIFANANPADIAKWTVLPMSSYNKTGNNLVEKNRIHNNSWGVFIENAWNLGDNYRYNLIYENHHADSALAMKVKSLPDGSNQPGGAFLFKDVILSPSAIYNNTFWHNYLIFGGHWRAGAQHLVFNNIYAQPYTYWNKNATFPNPFHALDPAFMNRMKNCVYSCQAEQPKTSTITVKKCVYDNVAGDSICVSKTITDISLVRIMNGMDQVKVEGLVIPQTVHTQDKDTVIFLTAEWVIKPGALIGNDLGTKPFPQTSSVRWLEMKFLSTEPDSPDFLVPDWNDSIILKYIKDAGCREIGIFDADGSNADLGALPLGGIPAINVNVESPQPLLFNNNNMIININVNGNNNQKTVQYVKLVRNLIFQADIFGGNAKPIPENSISTVSFPSTLQNGINNVSSMVPDFSGTDIYGFLEMVISQKDESGKTSSSPVIFFPYRKSGNSLNVKILDINDKSMINTAYTGEKVLLRIEAAADTSLYPISTVEMTYGSGDSPVRYDGSELKVDTLKSIFEDTIAFVNPGLNYVLFSGYTENVYEFQINCTSNFITVLEPIAVRGSGSAKPRIGKGHYTVFTINGKKIRNINESQLKSIKNDKILKQGTYILVPDKISDLKYSQRVARKVVIP